VRQSVGAVPQPQLRRPLVIESPRAKPYSEARISAVSINAVLKNWVSTKAIRTPSSPRPAMLVKNSRMRSTGIGSPGTSLITNSRDG